MKRNLQWNHRFVSANVSLFLTRRSLSLCASSYILPLLNYTQTPTAVVYLWSEISEKYISSRCCVSQTAKCRRQAVEEQEFNVKLLFTQEKSCRWKYLWISIFVHTTLSTPLPFLFHSSVYSIVTNFSDINGDRGFLYFKTHPL